MKLSPQDIALIEKYVSGTLGPEEEKLFQQKRQHTEFATEVELYTALRKSSRSLGRDELRKQMTEWDQKLKNERPRITNGRWFLAAAMIAVGIVMVAYFFIQGERGVENLYLTFYEDYPNLVDPIEKGVDEKAISISQLYESGRYDEAAALSPPDSLQRFYQALAFMKTGNLDQTINTLEQLLTDPSFRFRDAAQWYLALSYFDEDRLRESRSLLAMISEQPGHDFQDSALRMLTQWPVSQ